MQLSFNFDEESPSAPAQEVTAAASELSADRKAELLAEIRRRRQMRETYASLSASLRG